MKVNKYFCDRCGREISEFKGKSWFRHIFLRKPFLVSEIKAKPYVYCSNYEEEIKKSLEEDNKVVCLEFVSGYDEHRKSFELCEKCRKSFERWIKEQEK